MCPVVDRAQDTIAAGQITTNPSLEFLAACGKRARTFGRSVLPPRQLLADPFFVMLLCRQDHKRRHRLLQADLFKPGFMAARPRWGPLDWASALIDHLKQTPSRPRGRAWLAG